MSTETSTLTRKDLKSDQEVRWCPGCGDYAILNTVQGALANLGIKKEDFCVVSGIGCSSRFPYYMDTYGFHSIHGRAPAFATGIKLANPDLSVWLITGDGDAMSIGGNHLIHILRRNVDVKILLFNNEIYGLTKGQYSPTSRQGLRTKTSPMGSVESPFNPLKVALGAGASFVARAIDTDAKHLTRVLQAAAAHKGACFVEVFQNCVIFNDGTFDSVAEKKQRAEHTVELIPGEPIIYGADRDKGLRINGFDVEICSADEASVWRVDHASSAPSLLMAEIERDGNLPTPIGIFRAIDEPIYEEQVHSQIATATEQSGPGSLHDLVYAGDMWTVE